MVTGTTPAPLNATSRRTPKSCASTDGGSPGNAPPASAGTPTPTPNGPPAIWSGARAALLTQRHRDDNTYAGALHTEPGSVVAFRTDAVYLTSVQNWPYHHQPGDYLLKGHLAGPGRPRQRGRPPRTARRRTHRPGRQPQVGDAARHRRSRPTTPRQPNEAAQLADQLPTAAQARHRPRIINRDASLVSQFYTKNKGAAFVPALQQVLTAVQTGGITEVPELASLASRHITRRTTASGARARACAPKPS